MTNLNFSTQIRREWYFGYALRLSALNPGDKLIRIAQIHGFIEVFLRTDFLSLKKYL